jgi:hypothetical protein
MSPGRLALMFIAISDLFTGSSGADEHLRT